MAEITSPNWKLKFKSKSHRIPNLSYGSKTHSRKSKNRCSKTKHLCDCVPTNSLSQVHQHNLRLLYSDHKIRTSVVGRDSGSFFGCSRGSSFGCSRRVSFARERERERERQKEAQEVKREIYLVQIFLFVFHFPPIYARPFHTFYFNLF